MAVDKELTPKQLHRMGVWDRWRDGEGIVRCYARDLEGCRGKLAAAHWISVQRIRTEMGKVAAAPWRFPEPDGRRKIVLAGLDAVVADDRNGVPLCTAHHDSFDTRNGQSLHLPAPECVREFAAEYGLEHLIEEEL